MKLLALLALPAFADNYIWMLHDGTRAVVVDPGDAAPVHHALRHHKLLLAGILVTHHHADHTGGVDALRPVLQGAVWGPARENIPKPYEPLNEGDEVSVMGLRFGVIDVPGHTAGHIAFMQQDAAEAPLLFCGDTLFSAGCGRLFEGTAAQMHDSLAKLALLPGDTRVCCGHEYTLSNLRFAEAVEPGNAVRVDHAQRCQDLRAQGQPTLPSSMALELQINPFLRCAEPEVMAAAQAQGAGLATDSSSSPTAVFAALREWKNRYR